MILYKDLEFYQDLMICLHSEWSIFLHISLLWQYYTIKKNFGIALVDRKVLKILIKHSNVSVFRYEQPLL